MAMTDIERIGMSASERMVRMVLAQAEGVPDDRTEELPLGVLRTLMRDLDMWREISTNEIDKWSFDALVVMAKRMLDEVYPETVFTGQSVGMRAIANIIADHVEVSDCTLQAAEGVALIQGIDNAADAVVELLKGNSGVRFVILLRQLIREIEARPNAGRPPP
jgi:hypothetical protein